MNLNATLIAQLIVFLILVWFTVKYVWPPIEKVLDQRINKIAEGLAAAERGRSDFEQAERMVSELLSKGNMQVTEIVANAEKRANQIIEEAKVQAANEVSHIAEQAKLDLERDIKHAREVLRSQVSILAVRGAESILQYEIDRVKYKKILDELEREL